MRVLLLILPVLPFDESCGKRKHVTRDDACVVVMRRRVHRGRLPRGRRLQRGGKTVEIFRFEGLCIVAKVFTM